MKKIKIDPLVIGMFSMLLIIIIGSIIVFFTEFSPTEKKIEEETVLPKINLEIKNAYIQEDDIIIEVKRDKGKGRLSRIKFFLSSGGDRAETIFVDTDLSEMQTSSFVISPTRLKLSEIKNIHIAPIVSSDIGTEIFGTITGTYNFIVEEDFQYYEPEDSFSDKTKKKKCTPKCLGLQCGKDPICGELCGTCDYGKCLDGICSCVSETFEKTCEGFCKIKTNNCGKKVDCGECAPGEKVEETCEEKCANVNFNCGKYDNCNCGTCKIGQQCTDLKLGGRCIACLETCVSNKYNCGNWNFCGKTINCGTCSNSQDCSIGSCTDSCEEICKKANYDCGNYEGCDCGTCSNSQSCSSGKCSTSCSNECSFAEQRQCFGTGYQTCGNWDSDDCLEWGTIIECSSGEICSSGSCMTQTIIPSLVVVVDFLDKKLEDYTGVGINSISDIERILDKMTSHWEWMSVGTETLKWDIVRITLPHNFTNEELYPCNKMNPCGWVAFRDEIVTIAKQKINPKKYDQNNDGVIDNIFAIVSSGEIEGNVYIIGGASENQGARIFLDPQGSTSVRGENYGNFNHEIGHGIGLIEGGGLPDIYGNFDTLSYLTLMSSSWPLPAFGFSAYERIRLGWVKPQIINSNTQNIFLLPAEQNLQAVKVTTDDAKEYFLIEYRKKPSSGYGSSTYGNTYHNFNGLAIYHVNEKIETGNQNYPPLLYFEPADGSNSFPSSPQTNEFWFPGNLESKGVFSAKKYGESKTIFKVENIRWSGEGIMFDVIFY